MKNGFAHNSFSFLTGIIFIQRKIENGSACTRHRVKGEQGVLIFPRIYLKEVHAVASILSPSKSPPSLSFHCTLSHWESPEVVGLISISIMLLRLLILLKGFLFIFFWKSALVVHRGFGEMGITFIVSIVNFGIPKF